jgi:large subunit ribosomal protein L29
MPTTSTVDLRGLANDELVSKLREAKEELFNHGRLRAVRKEIARLYTVMRERELGITPVESSEGAA